MKMKHKPIKNGIYPAGDVEIVRVNHLTMPTRHIALMLDRSVTYVTTLKKKNGIVTPPDIQEMFRQMSHIKAGTEPFNKGRRMTEWMTPQGIENSSRTRFNSNRMVYNEAYDGAIRWREFAQEYFIRISKARWIPYKWILWEKAHGPIPERHMIQYKDGNPRNCTTKNLYCIPKSFGAQENKYGGYKIPYELRYTIQNITTLKRKIYEYQKQINRPEQSPVCSDRTAQ